MLFLFDKHFDFSFLKKSFDSFSEIYFENNFTKDKSNSIQNYKQVLVIAKNVLNSKSRDTTVEEAILKSKEFKSLLINFDIFQNDLKLFCQELAVMEDTIHIFLKQVWMLQEQIKVCLTLSPLVSKESSGNV